ncbi:response regulator transcription factor [Pontibacter sp. SGAir0037]|uniref:response regulator transcription factor n=1 Tax=Pontibacter sp. SGAir0037 TaxID=2571030 RepID=UPI0010CD40EE|nr:response regulator transcription factor [Pontibacter sp. SGAir0037]QCR21451.1 DNA-binding response regulator [Pontibacter sp. SGAir0037]
MIKLILTDDHKIIRDGVKALLRDEQNIQVVGEASDGEELIELLSKQSADVVLMDINMPRRDGFETTRYLKEHFPSVMVLVLSMHNHGSYVNKVLEAGAKGYILKNAGKEELTSAIKLVASGNLFICSDVALELLKKAQYTTVRSSGEGMSVSSPAPESPDANTSQHRELTKREVEVLLLIAEGYTNAEIADRLFTSKRTVETHRQNLLEKTQMKNTATLIKFALQNGLIS